MFCARQLFSSACITLCLASVIVLVSGYRACAQPTKKSDAHQGKLRAVQLKQIHYFLGNTTVTACMSGVRIDSTGRLNWALVAREPNWDVTVFRDDDKKYKRLPLKDFDIAGLMPQFVQTFRPRAVPSAAPPYAFKFFGFPARRVVNQYQNHEYMVITSIAAPQAERIVFASYRLPTGFGLPLRYIGTSDTRDFIGGIDKKGYREQALKTTSAKEVYVSPDFFIPPKNYTPVKNMQEVVVSNQGREQSEEFQTIFQGEDRAAAKPVAKKDTAKVKP